MSIKSRRNLFAIILSYDEQPHSHLQKIMFPETQVYIEQLYVNVNLCECVCVCVCVHTEREKRKKGREGREYIE